MFQDTMHQSECIPASGRRAGQQPNSRPSLMTFSTLANVPNNVQRPSSFGGSQIFWPQPNTPLHLSHVKLVPQAPVPAPGLHPFQMGPLMLDVQSAAVGGAVPPLGPGNAKPPLVSASVQPVRKRVQTLINQFSRTPSQAVAQPESQSTSRSPAQIAAQPSVQRIAGLTKKPSKPPPNARPRQLSAVRVKEQSDASAQDKSTSPNASPANLSSVASETPKAVGVVADRSAEKRDVRAAPPQPPVSANDLQSEGTEAEAEINASVPTQSALRIPFDD